MLVLGMAIGLIALNASVVFGLARLFGLRSPPAIEAGLLLAGGGEFAFVILSAAMGDGIVDRSIGQTVLVSSTLSMMCIPLLAALGLKLGGRKVQGEGLSPEPAPIAIGEKPRVLVVGYGRVGRLVGEMLTRHAIPWVAAERDPRLVEAARRAGESIFFGDASRPEFLKQIGRAHV